MDIKCVHGESGWCDQCAQTSKQAKEASLASNMTTRQAFAMAAMQGMLANSGVELTCEERSKYCVMSAYHLLKELDKECELIGGDHEGN